MSDPDRTTVIRNTVTGPSPHGPSHLGGLIAGLDQLDLVLTLPEYPVVAVGQAFGRFQLVARLGAGRFGVVILAEDPRLSRLVAVKVPQPMVLADPALRDRFLREARAAAALDHPGIVPVFETGEVGGLPYLATGFVDGPTLAGWLAERGGRVGPREAAGVVRAIAEAIHHAHERGVLHCDLKPGNVLMAPDEGPHPTPVVADFGLARLVGDDPALTRTYGLLGTPLYMAPEQARGDRRGLTARTDTHALGVILYELLTGRPPYAGEDSEQVLRRVEADQPPCPGAVNPAVPRDLRAICLRCLQKDPRDRYPSAGELAADLGRFLAGKPVLARQVGPLTRAGRLARRNPLGVAAAVAVGGLLAGLGVVQAGRWAADVRHRADLRAEAAERAKAEDRAAAAEFVTAVERVRRRRADREPDWPAQNLADLRRLAASPVAADHLVTFRTEAAVALGGFDLGTPRPVGTGFKAYNPAFSPDGKLLALGGWRADLSGACRVKVFDVATGAEVRSLSYEADTDWARRNRLFNADGCRAITWGPDGRWLVVGTRSGRLVRWDMSRPDPRPVVWRHSPPGSRPADEHLRELAFTPSGRVLVTRGHHQVVGWNARENWAEVFRREGGAEALPRRARPDDPVFAATDAGGGFRVLDQAPWVKPAAIPLTNAAGPRGEWFVAAWPDSEQLHLFRGEGPVRPSGAFRLPGEDRAEDGAIFDVLVHPNGHLMAATAEHARHLKVWSVVGGDLVAARTLDEGSLRVAFSPNGDRLAVVAETETLVYDLRGRGVCQPVGVGAVPLADADLTPDGRAGASISTGQLDAPPTRAAHWGADGSRTGADEPGPIGSNNRVVALDPAGGWVCYPVGDGCVVRGAPFDGPGLAFPEHLLRDLRADPAGRLWSAGGNGLRRWDVRDRTLGGPPLEPAVTIRRTGGVIYDCVAPGVADVWAGRADGVVCRHPAAGGDPDRMVAAFTAGVAGITRSADGTRVLAGSAAGGVKVLDAETGRVDLDLPAAHRDAVQGLAFLPGGWFATGSRDRTVKVWDAAGRLVLLLPQTRPVRRLFPSADGTALTVLAEGERGLRRWDMTALKAGLADLGIDPALP